MTSNWRTLGETLSEAEIARAQAFESGPIRSNDVGLERFSRGNQPGVVLTHSPRCAPLQESAPPRLREVQSLNRKALERCSRSGFVGRTFQDFLHADNRDDKRPTAQRRQEASGRTNFAPGRFALERDQEGRVQQGRTTHGFLCASPNPLPADSSTHSIKSSAVSIGPARSMSALMTSDFGTLLRRAHRARRAARFLSSLTVIVGIVIRRYYHVRQRRSSRAIRDLVVPEAGAGCQRHRTAILQVGFESAAGRTWRLSGNPVT